MKGQQQLSPRKYIETRARSLPINKCFVNTGWEEARLADVVVTRRHTNGHLTAGVFLVDLLCLGVKDTFFFFNEFEETLNEKLPLNSGMFQEIDYSLAHNIIYAGHDFAMEYDIHPHKDFQTTKYILEEDTDDIPLIEIPTGDKNGNPHLLVTADYNYKPALDKLKKNAGEGAFTFTLKGTGFDDLEETEWDEDEWSLDEIEPDFLGFSDAKFASGEELDRAFKSDNRSVLDKQIISIEMILRTFNEVEPGWDKPEEEIREMDDYIRFDMSPDNEPGDEERVDKEIKRIAGELGPFLDKKETEQKDAKLFAMFEEHAQDEILVFVLLNLLPIRVLENRWETVQQQFTGYLPLVQLVLTTISLALDLPAAEPKMDLILKSRSLEEAFHGHRQFYGLHHKIFWAARALSAMHQDNKEQLQHYHSMLTLSDLPTGQLKLLYVLTFSKWLQKELKRRVEEE